jgi:hypothetical protein
VSRYGNDNSSRARKLIRNHERLKKVDERSQEPRDKRELFSMFDVT